MDEPDDRTFRALDRLTEVARFDQAIEAGAGLIERFPKSARLRMKVARSHAGKREYAAAVRLVSEALALAPGEPAAHFMRALWRLELGATEEAIDDCDALLALESSSPNPHYSASALFIRAFARRQLGDYHAALDDCRLVPDDMVLWIAGDVRRKAVLDSELQRLARR